MKNTTRILSAVLTLVMVLGCMAGFTFTSAAAEEEVNLALNNVESMIMFTRGDRADGLGEFTDGKIDDTNDGFWTLGGGSGYYCDDEGNTLPLEENPAVVEAKLDASYEITAIKVGFLTAGEVYSGERYYHWEAYATNDNTLPISEWTKIAEKKTNELADGSGYKVTLTTPASYQYIRVYGVYNSCNDGSSHEGKIQMNELEIWGIDPNAGNEPEVLLPTPWVAPANGTNIIAGNETCVVKIDRGNMPHMTDGIVSDKPGDNYWTAGYGGATVPEPNPIENENDAWFQVNLDEVSEIDAIRIVTLLDDAAIYHWEVYATDDPEMAVEGWDLVAAKTTDEISNSDGYVVYLEEPIEVNTLRIYGTYCNLKGSDNRFRVSEIELWDIEGEVTPPEPPVEPAVDTLEINPYVNGDISGWENWSDQTQLLIRVDNKDYEKDLSAYTWEITLKNGEESKTISLVPSTAIVAWLYRFETCLGEGDNQFIPVNGTEYTVSVKVYDGETLVAESAEVAGFKPFQEPIVPETDPVDPPVDPVDPPVQSGDAAIYATIAVAVAVAAVALVVVYRKRSTI